MAYDAASNLMASTTSRPTRRARGIAPLRSTTYDSAGQRADAAYDHSSGTATVEHYSYDPSGQVSGIGRVLGNSYSYDLNGNRNATGYTTGAGNELTNSPGMTYTYDNDGNMISATTSSGTTTYTYDYENRLTSVDQHGTVIATYTYDVLGRRIGIDDSGTQTWTVFNGTNADANPYADFNARARCRCATSSARRSMRSWLGQVRAGRRPGT